MATASAVGVRHDAVASEGSECSSPGCPNECSGAACETKEADTEGREMMYRLWACSPEDEGAELSDCRSPTHAAVCRELVSRFGRSLCGNSSQDLEVAPRVAALLRPTANGVEEALPFLADVEVCASASLRYHREPRVLHVIQLHPQQQQHVPCVRVGDAGDAAVNADGEGRILGVASQLEKLQALLRCATAEARPAEGPWLWPLHDLSCSAAMFGAAMRHMAGAQQGSPRWLRAFWALRVCEPPSDKSVHALLREHHGPGIAFTFEWAELYLRRLWILAAFCVLALFFGADPESGTACRVAWETLKTALLAWGFWLAFSTSGACQSSAPEPEMVRGECEEVVDGEGCRGAASVSCLQHDWSFLDGARNPRFNLERARLTSRVHLVFLAAPVLALFALLTITILLAVVQLNAWLTYAWGDCVQLGCKDPEAKHGFVGWLTEVSSDILLAIVFEGLLALSRAMGTFVANMQNLEWMHDYEYAVEMHSVALEALGKVGSLAILAFVFVPQWVNDEAGDMAADCSDLLSVRLVGKASFSCLRRRLPLQRRRWIFQRSLKGPFCVGPFVAILVKVIVPWVADRLELLARQTRCCLRRFKSLGDALARILALIFAYDGDNVGFARFVVGGWPFRECVRIPEGSPHHIVTRFENADVLLGSALEQAAKKPFDPLDELLEVKLNFLWVVFFAPIMPWGIFPTLLARFLEVHSDLTKMLFVRRRVFPRSDGVLRATQRSFALGTMVAATVWYLMLSLVTYNDHLWVWM